MLTGLVGVMVFSGFGGVVSGQGLFLAPDSGTGGGQGTGDGGAEGQAGGSGDGGAGQVDFEVWLESQPEEVRQAHVVYTKGLKSALDAEREAKRRAEKARAEAEAEKGKAEEERLEREKQYETLAMERKEKLEELAPKVVLLESERACLESEKASLEAVLERHVSVEMEGLKLPVSVLELLEGKSAVEKLSWLEKNGGELKGKGVCLPASPVGGAGDAGLSRDEEASLLARTY